MTLLKHNGAIEAATSDLERHSRLQEVGRPVERVVLAVGFDETVDTRVR